jgi:hypothetical protein
MNTYNALVSYTLISLSSDGSNMETDKTYTERVLAFNEGDARWLVEDNLYIMNKVDEFIKDVRISISSVN